MRFTGIHFQIAAALLFAATGPALQGQTNTAPPRLAILSLDSPLDTANDLLTVALSKHENVSLLERAQIQKVWHEQELSAAGQDFIKLGQVLGADGLAILQTVTEGTNRFLQSRLVAVKPGVVIAEFRSPWPVENLDQWAGLAANDFLPLLPKITVLAKDAVPLSILSLRSSLRTPANQELERELTILLIHRLTHERDVFVLERQHLNDALAEKQLATDDSPFWTGRYLLDGTIDKDGYDPVTATISARLASSRGGEPMAIEISGLRTNLNALAESLVGKVLSALHRNSTLSVWNSRAEADQFFEEAQWAYRWKLLPEAAAAAESAWALGRRDKATAEVRIRAYSDQFSRYMISGGDLATDSSLSGASAPLAETIRAQELFCRDSRLAFTDTSAPDTSWYDLGLGVVRSGSAALEHYCHNVELRPGNDESLALLRSMVRQTVSILEKNDARPSADTSSLTSSIRSSEWQNAGYWFEKPEDALLLFRRLVEQGLHPVQLPTLAAWSWPDRRRVPNLLKQWVTELSNDTNMPIRLEGLILSLMRAPDDGSGLRDELENQYMTLVWDNRRWLLESPTNFWPLGQIEAAFNSQFPYGNFSFSQFGQFEHRLETDYLANPSSAKEASFEALIFPVSFGYMNDPLALFSASNVMELLPLMEKFQPQWMTESRHDLAVYRLRMRIGLGPGQFVPPSSGKRMLPKEELLEVPFTAWNLHGYGSTEGWLPALQDGILHGRQLILKIDYVPPRLLFTTSQIGSSRRTSFISFDPTTGVSSEILFPDLPYKGYDRAFDFTADSLFVTDMDKIYRHRFTGGEWETIPLPVGQ